MLESAVSKEEVRCQDVDLTAHMILGITATILRSRLTENEYWDTDDVVDIIMHGIPRQMMSHFDKNSWFRRIYLTGTEIYI